MGPPRPRHRRLTFSQRIEIAAFAENFAKDRFGAEVTIIVRPRTAPFRAMRRTGGWPSLLGVAGGALLGLGLVAANLVMFSGILG